MPFKKLVETLIHKGKLDRNIANLSPSQQATKIDSNLDEETVAIYGLCENHNGMWDQINDWPIACAPLANGDKILKIAREKGGNGVDSAQNRVVAKVNLT